MNDKVASYRDLCTRGLDNVIAEVYSEPVRARAILLKIDFPESRIRFFHDADSYWTETFRDIERGAVAGPTPGCGFDRLLRQCAQDYPGNPHFRQWHPDSGISDSVLGPPPESRQPGFAVEQGLDHHSGNCADGEAAVRTIEVAPAGVGPRPPEPVAQRRPVDERMSGASKRFVIALSFPGERRPFVAQVAEALAARVGPERVLYDGYYEAEFARPDLDTYLQRLYHDESELIAVFLCAEYERKDWCGLEWRALRDLIKRRQTASIMPLRFDATEIPGLFSGDGYVWIDDQRDPAQIAGLIYQRWQINCAQAYSTGGRGFSRTGAAQTPARPAETSTSCRACGRNDDQALEQPLQEGKEHPQEEEGTRLLHELRQRQQDEWDKCF